ncbi:two-component system response regulator, LytR/AlgR family [Psychroflexus torquis ATCC 700755]|uniref:Two-component system response regulator, LytR/AlgR family n=1 Tax=Psychroflexus torquis (strain ATCC 700755 / CIP 106069 / ACAM 623) TaxID=313595 RepID=K4IHX9_PSYTT|nr:LytTR family DNA-binding domain-containing protein [Psychroflexus torquis]AFU69418.1 two-component system response regulator, LytR/AlgR family [Psychroflexus torquis ATCC 700755]
MKCLIVDDEPLAHRIIKNYCNNLSFLDIVKECHSAFEAINYLNENQVDLIFLDINMPKLKGLDFLRTLSNPPLIIITSAYQEYAMEGYELNILDYLLKPFSFERFLKAINKAVSQKKLLDTSEKTPNIKVTPVSLPNNENQESIFIKGDKKTHQVQFDSILYLESIGSYVKIHLENETIISLDRLTNFENKLPKNIFLRIHRSYIIAIKKVNTIEGNRVKINKKEIPVGSVYKHNLTKFMK